MRINLDDIPSMYETTSAVPQGPPQTEPPEAVRVKPVNWWLAALPQEELRYVRKIYRDAYTNSGTNQITIPDLGNVSEIDEGLSLIAFAYHFFAEAPALGNRLTLLGSNEFFGLVELNLKVNGHNPWTTLVSNAGVARNGYPALIEDFNFWDPHAPLIIRGRSRMEFWYTVVSAPSFPVTNIGCVVAGYLVATSILDETLEKHREYEGHR